MSSCCRMEKVRGTSLLWGFPRWGAFIQKLPPTLAARLLVFLDLGARSWPGLADVLVAAGRPLKHQPGKPSGPGG